MAGNVVGFYEQLAASYHLIFEDWDSAIERQARAIGNLLTSQTAGNPLRILDCACGIGTQAIGLARMGHQVVASDLSAAAVNRAQLEARRRALTISFCVSDMTSLREVREGGFDVVVAMDNALPHLSAGQLAQAAAAIASKLKPDGLFMATIRDYDTLIVEKPAIQKPAFYGAAGSRRIVHQVWDWIESPRENARYILHLYITVQSDQGWKTHHFVSEYRCLLRHELSAVLSDAGFGDVRWLMPPENGFYQPIVLARLSG
ncbi:MAG: class I SAM-dependent methyltransferase [Terracidiphilus sp.]|jgi:2-polyprenyl-3-methyl-5-hydroxy-6-metoxy-1,4-benzoquinol methylase